MGSSILRSHSYTRVSGNDHEPHTYTQQHKLNVSLTQHALFPSNMRESMMEGQLESKETGLNQFKYLVLKVVQNHRDHFSSRLWNEPLQVSVSKLMFH